MATASKSSFLDKVLGRIARLDTDGLQQIVERLARERNFLETLLHTIEDGVLVVDPNGRVAYLNQAATRLLGIQSDAATGQPAAQVLPDLEWDKIVALVENEGPGVLRLELEVQYPRPRLLRLLAVPLAGEGQKPVGVAVVIHDATEARQQTVATVESERVQLLTLLAMSVAHELGNPLNALSIHLQLMERELKKLRSHMAVELEEKPTIGRRRVHAPVPDARVADSVDRLEKYLGVAKGEIARLDYIVTHFLQATRFTQPKLRPTSLNDVVNNSIELLRPELDNRGLLVEARLLKHLPEASLDPDQIKQALVNLIKNSMQAMSKGGKVTLETGVLGDGIWVSVTDTGVGIPRDQLNRLFEPLFTTKKKGSGLGLMIVYRIVRAHGGRIEVESKLGEGTTFRLWFPLPGRGVRLLEATSASSAESV
ncbi:MAG: PAS domain-containing protein [Verrucomicrobia bacterium]|nr:PAS domain-containing protein [Verrucomicrobiota bacterium]